MLTLADEALPYSGADVLAHTQWPDHPPPRAELGLLDIVAVPFWIGMSISVLWNA